MNYYLDPTVGATLDDFIDYIPSWTARSSRCRTWTPRRPRAR